MRGAVLSLRRYPRDTWLLAMMVWCVGAFLCSLPTELDVSAVLTTPHPLSPVQGANQGYLAVSQEPAERSGQPSNQLTFAHLAASMSQDDMGNLMPDHTGDLGFNFLQ